MSRDRTVGETFYVLFTTRAFSTGIPGTLGGVPVVSAYEDASITQITAGITLGVDHDGVSGLNLLTMVATGANGYEAGKDYGLVITTGTVGGVSVVGEVVGEFSLGLSAAFTRLGAPAGASVSADIAGVPTTSEFEARTILAAAYFDPAADTVANVTLVATTTTNTDMVGTNNAATSAKQDTMETTLNDVPTTAEFNARTLLAASYFDPAADTVANVTLVATTTTNTDMVGTNNALLASSDGSLLTEAGGTGDQFTALALSSTEMNKIADHTIRRTWANVEASSSGDAVSFRSLFGAIAKLVNKVAASGGTLTIYRDDDITALGTQALTTDATAEPIIGIDTN